MVKKGKIIFLLLTTIGLQIKTYCSPTKRSNFFKKVEIYKTFPLSVSGYLFSPNWKKVDIDEFNGYSIGFKLYKKSFLWYIVNIPHKNIGNIIGYFLYFRSFYLELIKSLKFCKTIHTVYHKGRHSVTRTSYFSGDYGYSLKKDNIGYYFSPIDANQKKEIKEGDECLICRSPLLEGEDIIVGHKNPKDEEGNLIHLHHKECLKSWLNTRFMCPYCKETIPKEIAEWKDDDGNSSTWIDIFRLSLQSVKYTYEYAFTRNRDFRYSFILSIRPLILSLEIPTVFFRDFSLKTCKEEKEFLFDWEQFFEQFFSLPNFINLSLCTKFGIGFIFFIQKIGALFELTYIGYYKRTFYFTDLLDFLIRKNQRFSRRNVQEIAEANGQEIREEIMEEYEQEDRAIIVEAIAAEAGLNIEKDAKKKKKIGHKFEFKITILINKDI